MTYQTFKLYSTKEALKLYRFFRDTMLNHGVRFVSINRREVAIEYEKPKEQKEISKKSKA